MLGGIPKATKPFQRSGWLNPKSGFGHLFIPAIVFHSIIRSKATQNLDLVGNQPVEKWKGRLINLLPARRPINQIQSPRTRDGSVLGRFPNNTLLPGTNERKNLALLHTIRHRIRRARRVPPATRAGSSWFLSTPGTANGRIPAQPANFPPDEPRPVPRKTSAAAAHSPNPAGREGQSTDGHWTQDQNISRTPLLQLFCIKMMLPFYSWSKPDLSVSPNGSTRMG